MDEEWKKKGPIIQGISLESFGIFHVSCFPMIGDDNHLIVAANVNKTKKAKIIIVDTKTLEVLKVLDIKDSNGIEQDVFEIKISIDKTFLVAYVHAQQLSNGSEPHYWIWKRNEDYSLRPLKLAGKPEKCDLLSHRLANTPFLIDGFLYIYREMHPHQIEYDEWDLKQDLKKRKIVSVPTRFLPSLWYTQRDDMTNIAALQNTVEGKYVLFGKEGFPDQSVLVTAWHFDPFTIGHSSDYIAVLLKSTPSHLREFQFYHYKSGKKIATLYGMRPGRLDHPFFEEAEVQFIQNQAAIW